MQGPTVLFQLTITYFTAQVIGSGVGRQKQHLHLENSIFRGCCNSINADPLFVSSLDFHLRSSSPCIGAGIDVGLTTDYDGNASNIPPSIGAFEYDSKPTSSVIPVYQSSAVENATPSLVEITYSLSLANIVPAASALWAWVNSAARSINSVTVSGPKCR